MCLRLLLFTFLAGFFSVAQAQNIRLTGKVLNQKNEPVPGVTVKITGEAGGTTTDVEGRYTLRLAPGKKYELEFTTIGYTGKTVNEVEVSDHRSNELNIVLEVNAKDLANVIVKATRSDARKESAASLITFQKIQIQLHQSFLLNLFVARLIKIPVRY